MPNPSVAASRLDDVASKIKAFIDTARADAVDGISIAEFFQLAMDLLRIVITGVDTLNVPGEERKSVVLDAAAQLFDAIADKCVPLALYPLWLAFRSPIRMIFIQSASGAIESLLPILRGGK
jgi:hypothetical protein